jgi:hypothetical protein
MSGAPLTLAQLPTRTTSPAYTGQTTGSALPKPHTPAQAIGLAILGLILLAAIFALVIKITRRDD